MKAIGSRKHAEHCPHTWKLCLSHRQAKSLIRKLNDHSMRTYRCHWCNRLHIGHAHQTTQTQRWTNTEAGHDESN